MTDENEGEGFARRWSRRKRQAASAPLEPLSDEALPAIEASIELETPVEIPPPPETIPIEDIAGWMKRKLPEGWREVALRRLWSADIGIRDFIGPADYAWDWNVPGGAPGWGPMRVADDMVRLLARAIGEAEPPVPVPPPEEEIVPQPAQPAAADGETEILPVDSLQIVISDCHEISPPDTAVTIPSPPRRGGRATPA